MNRQFTRKVRKLNLATHRDVGYFFSALIIAYCISGIALNHINDWNPDFIIEKKTIAVERTYAIEELNDNIVRQFGAAVGETTFKVYDSPTRDQVKIYYDNASLHINFSTGTGVYEKISRRPLFYQSNVLHRNTVTGWKWFSDIFALLLIVLTVTGLFVLKGENGIGRRGKWLIAAGTLPPILALVLNELS